MIKNISLLIIFISVFVYRSFAQENISSHEYKTSLGVKFYPGAITVKHFLNEKSALEGLGYFYKKGVRITALYEIYKDIPNVTALKWYFGPGVHVSFYSAKYGGGTAAGIDAVLGLDYKFKVAPINISLDWQPAIEVENGFTNNFTAAWGGLAVRYVF